MLHNRDRFEQWLPALFDGEFQWDFLAAAFCPTKIMPMDFDAVIERNGHVLIFETKSPGVVPQTGQKITLTNEWKRGSTIFHVEGKTAETICKLAVYWEGGCVDGKKFGDMPLLDANWTDVLFQTRRWFCRANGNPPPSREEWDHELWLWDHDRTKGPIPGLE